MRIVVLGLGDIAGGVCRGKQTKLPVCASVLLLRRRTVEPGLQDPVFAVASSIYAEATKIEHLAVRCDLLHIKLSALCLEATRIDYTCVQ